MVKECPACETEADILAVVSKNLTKVKHHSENQSQQDTTVVKYHVEFITNTHNM